MNDTRKTREIFSHRLRTSEQERCNKGNHARSSVVVASPRALMTVSAVWENVVALHSRVRYENRHDEKTEKTEGFSYYRQRLPACLLFSGRREEHRPRDVVLLDATVNIPRSVGPPLFIGSLRTEFRNGRSWSDREISQADANATEGKRTRLSLSISLSPSRSLRSPGSI